MGRNIHAAAIVDPKAEIDDDVEVGAFSIIGPNVKIGKGTRIAPHVVIEGITELGPDNEVFQFASIGAKPQDLKYHGEPSTLVIGSANKIREYVTLQPGTEQGGMTTRVGDRNLFMANSHVGHDCIIGSDNVFANSAGLAGHVTVFDKVILGGLVGIHQFCRIGDLSFLSAGSMIGHDVPPYCIAQGDRCFLRGINTIGLQRAGFSEDQIAETKKAYRMLASSGHSRGKVADFPEELSNKPHIKKMLDFVETSERGIMSTPKRG